MQIFEGFQSAKKLDHVCIGRNVLEEEELFAFPSISACWNVAVSTTLLLHWQWVVEHWQTEGKVCGLTAGMFLVAQSESILVLATWSVPDC